MSAPVPFDCAEPERGAVVLAWNGTSHEAFQRADDGWWRSTTGRSHGWKYLLQEFTPLALVYPVKTQGQDEA